MTTINQDDFQFGSWNLEDIAKRYMQRMMQPVQEAVWDMASGGLGILGKDGSILTFDVISKEDGIFGVSQNDFTMFAMPIPAFAQQISVDSVVIEDFVYVNGKPFGWVTKIIKSDSSNIAFEILKPNGQQSRWSPPKVQNAFTSGQNVQVLRTMTSMFGNNADNKMSEIQQMLPMMMMLGGTNGAGNIMQQMLPMMMMSGSIKMDPMMMFMLMQSGGFGGMNNQTVQNNQNTLANPACNNPFKRP